jgi:hypothetical protein
MKVGVLEEALSSLWIAILTLHATAIQLNHISRLCARAFSLTAVKDSCSSRIMRVYIRLL